MALYIEDRRVEGKQADKMQVQWNALSPTFALLQPKDVAAKIVVEGKRRTRCHKYALERERIGRARDTISSELSLLRTALAWAKKHNHIAETPHVWVPPPGKGRKTALTETEMLALIRELFNMPWHARLTLVIAMSTGARKEAILELEWSRVYFDTRIIDFNRGEQKSILDTSHEKGRAVVDMSDALYETLLEAWEWRDKKCAYVIEYRGDRVLDVKRAIQSALRRAGIYRRFMGLHALRHTLATWAAARGIDTARIQRMLGHADVKTTEGIYIQHKVGSLTDVADVVSALMSPEEAKRLASRPKSLK